MRDSAKPGISTIELDKITERYRTIGLKKPKSGYNFNINMSELKKGKNHGCGIVRDYVGHGINKKMHEDPQIPNFGSAGRAPRLKSGMTLAIEPMINLGTHKVKTLNDEWTVSTKDRKPSALFGIRIAIGDAMSEILAKR